MTIPDISLAATMPAISSLSPMQQPGPGQSTSSAQGASTRDAQSSELGTQRSTVNALRDAASLLGGTAADAAGGDATEPTLPPLPPMPAPAKPPAVATDDHGQSNIVFADGDADGSLIH